MDTFPFAAGLKVTKQLPEDRVQLAGLNVPAAPVSENVTEPAGAIAWPVDVSFTVAVQFIA